jgi:putative membrane protein
MVIPDTISEVDRALIRGAVIAAETKTSGEIKTVIARTSDDYRSIPLLWATLAALLVPAPLIFLTLMPAGEIYLAQLSAFVILAVVLSLPPVKPLVVPGPMKRLRAHRLAVDQFLAHGIHTTEKRTGVLIFVSLFEHHAEIVADSGIDAKVDQAVWDGLIAKLITDIRDGRLTLGMVTAIETAGDHLATHFPPRPRDPNEVSDELILL